MPAVPGDRMMAFWLIRTGICTHSKMLDDFGAADCAHSPIIAALKNDNIFDFHDFVNIQEDDLKALMAPLDDPNDPLVRARGAPVEWIPLSIGDRAKL